METQHRATHTIISELVVVHDPQYCFTVSCPTIEDRVLFIRDITDTFGKQNSNWRASLDDTSWVGSIQSKIYFNEKDDAVMFKLMFG